LARDPKTGLTDKQRRFCEEYLKDFNGAAAYRRAGYSGSESALRANSSKLIANHNVQAYLSHLRNATSQRAQVTLERTLDEISRVAFANITQVMSFDASSVTLQDSATLPDSITAAIESVTFVETESEHSTNRRKAVKMHNKMTALGFLADYFGIRDDFNKARATLKRYGLALVEDLGSEHGWRLEKYDPSGSDTAA
jgi:phage terminase small subunit